MTQKVIFNCDEVIQACESAIEQGGQLSDVFSLSEKGRKGPNGTTYMTLSAKVPGKEGPLNVRVVKERHVGQIAPLNKVDVDAINSARPDSKYPVKARDRDATININKYNVLIETNDDGLPTGPLPGDEHLSKYFRVVEFVDKFIYATLKERLASKKIYVQERGEAPPAGAIVASSAKIVPMAQTHVSLQSKDHPGMELPNPIARVALKFDKKSGMATYPIFDFTKSFKDEKTGSRQFEPLMFDGHPVMASNVHKIGSFSTVSGVVNLAAVCASNMGLSVPTRFEIAIIEPPAARGISVQAAIEGMFDDEDFGPDEGTPGSASAAASAASAAATAVEVDEGALGDDEVDAIVDGLGV